MPNRQTKIGIVGKKDMKKAKWIWIENDKPDVHAEFLCVFRAENSDIDLHISCDGNYVVFLNDRYVGFGQMSDFGTYKLCDRHCLCDNAVLGENKLQIFVWHIGVDSVNYRTESAGVCFEITEHDEILAYSDEDTRSRLVSGYKQNYCRMIAQVGITSLYDFTKAEAEYTRSGEVEKQVTFADENVQNLRILPFQSGKVLAEGKTRILIDLGKEFLGFLDVAIRSETDGNAFTVFFGEHILPNGQLLREIANCHFGLDFVAKKGRNAFKDYFRPIGCRYLEIVSERDFQTERLGIVPIEYPFEERKVHFNDSLDEKIYRTCIDTLKCCTMKHYVDCPWREQGMYVLDSRNQMLCGYYAFEEFALARFNLVFLSKGMTPFGLLSSCPPSRQANFIIPFFSLIYIVQVYEYVEYSEDDSILVEVERVLTEIIYTFLDKIDANGLIPRFSCEHFWNFYEWTTGSDGWPCNRRASEERRDDETYDLILNAAFALAVEKYMRLMKKLDGNFSFPLSEYRAKLKTVFYDADKRLFRLHSDAHGYSRLGCSMALLAKVTDGDEAKEVARTMLNDESVVDCSLACATFFYDALLDIDSRYEIFVLRDIREKYKYMLDNGATTFWETLNGSAENGGIGSLCHGWSAIPIYYYHKYFLSK